MKEKITKRIEFRVSIFRCARCGQDHHKLPFVKFEQPVEDSDGTTWTHWATCPNSKDPILMKSVSIEQSEGVENE